MDEHGDKHEDEDENEDEDEHEQEDEDEDEQEDEDEDDHEEEQKGKRRNKMPPSRAYRDPGKGALRLLQILRPEGRTLVGFRPFRGLREEAVYLLIQGGKNVAGSHAAARFDERLDL